MKKILALVIGFCLAFSMLSTVPAAATGNHDWKYGVTCSAVSGSRPNNDSVDSNIRIKNLSTGETRTFNYHGPDHGKSGPFTYDLRKDYKVPSSWTKYQIQWVQVNGTNFHWEGALNCGKPKPPKFKAYEVKVCWTMSHTDGKEGTYQFPQTFGCKPPKCDEVVEYQYDTYWIRDKSDEALLKRLKREGLNSPADDKPLEPHGYYSKVVKGDKCEVPPVTPPVTPEPPVTPPTPQPPVCDDECAMPVVATKAPNVIKCRGVLSGKVLRNVVIPRGSSCTLVDTYVNGSVRSNGGHDLYLADANVRGNIKVRNMTGDVVFGSKDNACRYDPYVGGSIVVKNSHNVLVCQASVCKDIVVQRNDGKITLRDSSARRVVVRSNKRFVADGTAKHRNESVIRVFDVDGKKVIKNNAPRRVAVR